MGKSVEWEKLSTPHGSDCAPGFEVAAFGGEVDRLGLRSDFIAFSSLVHEVVAELQDDRPALGSLATDIPYLQAPHLQTRDRAVA
jgi:hypothetical protein